MSRYGSCETGRTEDSEGTERHLETPISLTGKRIKKKNLRQTQSVRLSSYAMKKGCSLPKGIEQTDVLLHD